MMAKRLGLAAVALAAVGCAPIRPASPAPRIVSIDYCADQMLLGLADRRHIAAVSVDVASDPLFSLPRATGIHRIRPRAEEVLALRPTLVVRSYGGGPRFEAALRRAGVDVFTLPYAATIADIGPAMTAAGKRLGAIDAARQNRAQFDAAVLRAVRKQRHGARALYVTPGNVTTGAGSLIADLLTAAGFRPYLERPGWHRLPIEQIMGEPPALVVRGFFETRAYRQDRWAASGHASLDDALRARPTVSIPGSELACGNWLVGRALDRLVAAS